MAFRTRINRRLALPFILAVVLASEVTGLALAVHLQPLPSDTATAVPAAHVSTSAARQHSAHLASFAAGSAGSAGSAGVPSTPSAEAESRIRASSRSLAPARSLTAAPATSSPVASTRPKAAPAAPAYHGRNHVWIPKLGINRSVASFPCSRSRPPDNYMYRWGCAGRNNVYLLGHAYSVFKPLHDAYVGGRLRKGMKVIYADGSGHVRTYAVIWWKVTRPTTSASWAWAALSRPSMTLQTCVGAHSEYRLIVRLVAVG